jgi:hypothetical protein
MLLQSRSHTIHIWRARGERRYISYSFTAYRSFWLGEFPARGVSGQRHARAALWPRERIPGIHWSGGWVGPEPVWADSVVEKPSSLCRGSNLDHPVIQSVERHYTDWATPANKLLYTVCDRRMKVAPILPEITLFTNSRRGRVKC